MHHIKSLDQKQKMILWQKKIMLTKFGYISSPYRLENSILSIKFWHFLKGLHKFVHSLIFMNIWDFAYFLNIKTMGISPTLGFDTTTTPTRASARPIFNWVSALIVIVVRAAPDIPEMSVPGVGYSFKPKGLAFVTPLYPVSQTD